MSEPKLISPLLDGFSIGAALSEHDGVRCYPALQENSEKRYILKIVSIPATQTQLDALLLTGAYKEPAAVLEYFRELADTVEKEAACLKNLSRLEGFLAFEGWQVVPMDQGNVGFEIYLLGSFRQALEKYVRRNTMTHLEAVNLGIDLCNALSAARRAGWIYVDLKPSNIFISENKEYRIGDLGLLELEGLELAALPAKYRSPYTSPELRDEMLSPNTTQDTYALGLILYQIYNNGQLPQVPHPGEDPLPPPANADYELAEILLKACDPQPSARWESPVEMGQALVAYMQRNTVTDTPIIPPLAQIPGESESLGAYHPKQDETLPGIQDLKDLTREDLTAETSDMIDQADDLIHHDLPAPPIAPEGISLEQLEADVLQAAQAKKQADAQTQATEDQPDRQENAPEQVSPAAIPAQADPGKQQELPDDKDSRRNYSDLGQKRKQDRRRSWAITAVLILLLTLLGGAGYLYYNEYYVQSIHTLTVEGSEDSMIVRLDTAVEDSLLTVFCTDTYGNTSHSPVENGCAAFPDLLPDMLYRIRVEIDGFHRLIGSTTHEYVTPAETTIASFTAVTGPEDGSVVLNFTVNGPDSEEWTAICTAEDAQTVSQVFTGHMATVTGLNIGSTYHIRLVPTAKLYIPGSDSLEFTASSIIIAEKLSLSTDSQGVLTVTWQAPEGASVDSWYVRCYSVDGYDESLTTNQLTASFPNISAGSAYTVEVTAAGMTQAARAGITANPIYVTGIRVDESDPMTLKVSWDYSGTAPEGGWLLLYTIDGSEQAQVVQCGENSGVIEVRVPAATYDLTVQAADGSTVFQNTHTHRTSNAEVYQNEEQAFYRRLHPHLFFVNMLKTPEKADWTHADVHKGMYTGTFAPGDGISVLMYYMNDFYIRHEDITVMYVIRDENGNVLTECIAMENLDWRDDLWNGPNYHYCGLDIPQLPTEPGNYSLGIYFDGLAVTLLDFTIAE